MSCDQVCCIPVYFDKGGGHNISSSGAEFRLPVVGWLMNKVVKRQWKNTSVVIFKVLGRHMFGRTEETHENLVKMVGVTVETGTRHSQNTSHKRYAWSYFLAWSFNCVKRNECTWLLLWKFTVTITEHDPWRRRMKGLTLLARQWWRSEEQILFQAGCDFVQGGLSFKYNTQT
jgi:hypothetical protein